MGTEEQTNFLKGYTADHNPTGDPTGQEVFDAPTVLEDRLSLEAEETLKPTTLLQSKISNVGISLDDRTESRQSGPGKIRPQGQ
jgi:hypothetical protein